LLLAKQQSADHKIKKKSTVKSLGAVVIIRKKNRIPLKEFGARQNASGVSYKIRKQKRTKADSWWVYS
jgi:hypothetical protein